MGRESHLRSVAKGASYRVIATLSTLAISFLMTGSVKLATLIGSSEALAKILLYWGHERVWHRIPWGRAVLSTPRLDKQLGTQPTNESGRQRWLRAAR